MMPNSALPASERIHELFRVAIDSAPCATLLVDAHGNIALVNKRTEQLFGYGREELAGQGIEILLPQRQRARHATSRWNYMKETQIREMGTGRDFWGVRKDGTEIPIEVALNPVETEHGVFILTAIVDITRRKMAEDEIKRLNQELECRVAERTAELTAANADMESFSYSIAHDLRAPLRQVAGFARILAEECGSEISAAARHHLQKIQDGAELMGNLVDDLLSLAKLNREPLHRRDTSLNDLIAKAVEELKPECLGRQIEWRIGTLGPAECDPALFLRVFVNLLSNAIKFTSLREHAVIEIGESNKAIFVRDNGAGFDMAYAGKLFGVFQRLHSAKQFEGTGVGLANVQRIIHKHGGRIWAEAEVNRGATFYFTIPPAN